MKINSLKVTYVVMLLAAFTSCTTMRVTYTGKKVNNVRNIALYSTMIGKIQQPLFPLIDAAAFNQKTNSIADQIMDMQKKNIDKCREIVASSLKKHFSCNILYADSLHAMPGYAELKNKYDFKASLKTNSDHYPVIIAATDDFNPFRFEKGHVEDYFSNAANYKVLVSQLAGSANVDMVAVSYSKLYVIGAGMFGLYGNLRLDTKLYLFDKDGDLIIDAHSWSKQNGISGKEIEEYKAQLDNLSLILEPMMVKVKVNF